jgi:hypothetical protein
MNMDYLGAFWAKATHKICHVPHKVENIVFSELELGS